MSESVNSLSADQLRSDSSISDTAEIKLVEGGLYQIVGEKPTGFFSSAKIFFKAIFRSDSEKQDNRENFQKVAENIRSIHGEEAKTLFEQEMNSKFTAGTPLTKGDFVKVINKLGPVNQDQDQDMKSYIPWLAKQLFWIKQVSVSIGATAARSQLLNLYDGMSSRDRDCLSKLTGYSSRDALTVLYDRFIYGSDTLDDIIKKLGGKV